MRNGAIFTTAMIILGLNVLTTTQAQNNLKREVVFTLGQHERLFLNEHYVLQSLNKNRFTCIVKDTATKKRTFVFNGERVATTDGWFDIHYINPNEDNGYVFTSCYYDENKEDYVYSVNIKGDKYGKYNSKDDDVYLRFDKEKGYIFSYSQTKGKHTNYYINNNGNIEGPFENIDWNDASDDFLSYAYQLAGRWFIKENGKVNVEKQIRQWYKDGKHYVTVNGSPSAKGYDYVYDLTYHSNGNYAYRFKDNGKWYVNINGSPSEKGYDRVEYLTYHSNGNYAYMFKDNGKYYVNINGSPSAKGYDEVGYLTYHSNGNYAYVFIDNGKWYANINGKPSTKGYDTVWNLTYHSNVNYAYWFKDNGKWYLNFNGSPSAKGYDAVWYLTYHSNVNYAYAFKDNGKWYANINGDISKGYDEFWDLTYHSNVNYAYRFYDNGKYYVNINGKPSVKGYDDVWDFTYHSNVNYAYLFKDNGKWYANINGNISKGYDNIYNLSLNEKGEYSYYFSEYAHGRIYENKNGKTEKTIYYNCTYHGYDGFRIFDDRIENMLELTSPDEQHSFYSNYEYEYVVIDNSRRGNSPALRAWYDDEKKAFVWTSIEGKELVVYEYKLD
jgi:hypothetical protein